MKTIEEIRRDNLLRLIQAAGTIQAVADQIDKSHAQVSQWKNRSKRSESGRPAVMESDTARMIEQKFGKPEGWMDNDHDAWPFSVDLLNALKQLDAEAIRRIENGLRANFDMPSLDKSSIDMPRKVVGIYA